MKTKTKSKFKFACVDVDTNEILSMHRTAQVAERYLSYHRNGIYREYGRRGICSEAEVREIA